MNKLVLDATCGSRMIWFNKNNELAVFVDKRELDCEAIWTSGSGQSTRYCNIHPDIIADFTDLPFEDNTFYHVVFDPEHVYEVMALYPYCVLLRDTKNGVRTCPGYNTLSLMLRGSEVNE